MDTRPQTLSEEIANSISHGVGCVATIVAMPVLIVLTARHGNAANVVGATVFAGTMALLYLVSTLYHAIPAGRAKQFFVKLDHSAIYLFIAGSYTPFSLGALRGAWGWTLFGIVWGLAAVGLILKLGNRLNHPVWSTSLYLLMGWLVLIAAVPMIQRVSLMGLIWLAAGGLAYTIGVYFFVTDNLSFRHFIWHLFVLAGSICHFFAILWYAV